MSEMSETNEITKELKIGIIGLGGISVVHIDAYNQLKNEGYRVSLEAGCDIRQAQLEGFCGERKYQKIDEFMEAEKGRLDVVNICLPTFLHCETTIKALECGFHVVVEKPMALSYEDCVKMCEAAKRANKLLMVAQCVRFSDFIQSVRRYMNDGTFGPVKTACFKRDGGPPRWGWENWFLKKEMAGGALLDLHVHDVDALQYLFGMPESVSSGAAEIIPGDGYDIVSTNYYYPNGFFAHSTGDWTMDNNIYYNRLMRVDFERGYIIEAYFGDRGVFRAMGTDGSATELSPANPKSDYYKEIKYFIDCLHSGSPVSECPPESSAQSIRIALTEAMSAGKNGERLYL